MGFFFCLSPTPPHCLSISASLENGRCRHTPHICFQGKTCCPAAGELSEENSSCQPWGCLSCRKYHMLILMPPALPRVVTLKDWGREEQKGSDAAADVASLRGHFSSRARCGVSWGCCWGLPDFSLDPVLLPSPSFHRCSSKCTCWTGPYTVSENPPGDTGKGPVLIHRSHISSL